MPRRRSSTRFPTAACCWLITRCCCAGSTRWRPAPPKGALVHRLIRTGRSLFTAHTNADSASPGVSDALAHALGLTVEAVLEPLAGRGRSGQVGDLRAARERRGGAGGGVRGRRRPHRRLFALQLERHRHRAVPAARRRVTGHRQRRHRRAGGRGPGRGHRTRAGPGRVLAAMRAAHPYEEPAFDIFALVPPPGDVGLGRIGTLPQPESLRAFVSRVGLRCRRRPGGCAPRATPTWRSRGSRCAAAPVTRCWPPRPPPACRPTSRPICVTTPPTSIAVLRRWR